MIVDKASRRSLAAALPLASRAKRFAVIGGPSQLLPVVGLAETHGLSRHELHEAGRDHWSDEVRRRSP